MAPPDKRRKIGMRLGRTAAVEEVTFDNSARQEYLTGFHKRKVQRAKHGAEAAGRRAKEEKREARKTVCATFLLGKER